MNTKYERKTEMKTILIILAILILAALPVSAQIPRLINYQGVLTDDMGVVVSDGSYSMTFRLYDAPSGGTSLWEETIDVNVSKGIFNTTLGHDEPIIEVFDKPLYLTLEIAGGGELSPRRIFTANAYAFSSRAVYGVTNIFPAEGNVGIGYATPEAPLHIYTEITDPNTPALLIQNTGNHSLIDFKLATVTEARIRYSSSNDFFFGTLTSNGGVSLRTNDLTRLRVTGPGNVGIGTVGPQERLDVNGAIKLGTTTESNEGTIRWTGSDFEGYDGSLWHSLTSGGGSSLPSGSSTNTLRHNGADWVAATNLSNDGTNIGIGTSAPNVDLHIVNSTGQVGLQVDGYDGSWSSIYVNAQTAPGSPGYGYLRQGTIRGHHYLDSSYGWNLILNSGNAMLVEPGGYTAFGGTSLLEYMNIPGAIRIGNTTGSNEGTIRWSGSDFEGHDGAVWRSLTAGSLPSGTTHQTLRFDGADWVTSANLTNTGSAVGIGTATPDVELHLYGPGPMERIESNTPTGFAQLEILTSGGEFESLLLQKYGPSRSGTVAGITIADLSRISTGTEAGALMLQTGGTEHMHFAIGNEEVMRITDTGNIEGRADGIKISQLVGTVRGGIYEVVDELGNATVSLQPDANGTGGYLILTRNNGITGFAVDGNHLGTGSTAVNVYGTSSTITLDASSTGDDSVVLPTSAIASSEMFDEPGVASSTANTSTLIATTTTVLLSRTITVPASGYVLVIGTTQAQIGHGTGTGSILNVGVSAAPDVLPSNQDVGWLIPGSASTGTYTLPITVQGLFEVSAGANAFYLLARSATATATMYGLDKQLSLVYIPTNYGTVLPTLASGEQSDSDAPTDRGMSTGDISSERTASIAANNDRIERELAAMRERIATLESELGNK